MAVKTRLTFAAATDPGKRRKNNEDRYYVDADRGIYGVIDGVGGQAAGETAASVAVEVIRERLERQTGTPEERLREAITLANNEILRLARTKPEWAGMACVLTIAIIEEDFVTVGHVGDTRLYLLRRGAHASDIRKVTHDHSPVGEREDRGEITEEEAMRHARRNEIYRDAGSAERKPDAPGFIEIETFPMPADGLLLLCTDGLTDLITSGEIRAGIDRYAPDFDRAALALIEAANEAGGKDNITIVIVAAADYGVEPAAITADTTRTRVKRFPKRALLAGLGVIAMGIVAAAVASRTTSTGPRTLLVGRDGIGATMNEARYGDTVVIPQGRYRERVELREGVVVRTQPPGAVTLISPDKGPAVIVRKIDSGGIDGVWIQGDLAAPLAAGIEVIDASPFISHVKITGANVGIEVQGNSAPSITASQITNNLNAGIVVAQGATPRIEGNLIAANGNGEPDDAKPGVEVLERGHPLLKDNAIVDNAADPVWIHSHGYQPADYEENFFGNLPAKRAIRLIDDETEPSGR